MTNETNTPVAEEEEPLGISPFMAIPYAVSLALEAAVIDGLLTKEQADTIRNQADNYYQGLMMGRMLVKNKETGKYEVASAEESALVAVEGVLDITGDVE